MEVIVNWLPVFLFGLCVGSFLNVLIYRIPRNLGFVKGRSFCPKCKKKISWYDNIPLLSFILLRGKCRLCHSPISWRYPLVELLTANLFVLGSVPYLSDLSSLSYLRVFDWGLTLVLFSSLLVIFFIDLEHQIIPDKILLPVSALFIFRFVFFCLFTNYCLLTTIYAAFGASLFLFLIYLATKGRGMGFGDVKFAFLMGLALGFPKIIVAFYIAFLTGAISGIILIISKKAKFGQKIAFGPYLALSTFVTLLWGEKILSLVQRFLF